MTPRPLLRRALLAGLAVAAIDALFAVLLDVVLLHVCTTAELFQHIGSALLGRDAFRDGALSIALGVLLHVGVAYAWTAAFTVVWAGWPALRSASRSISRALAVGAALGVVIWLSMDLVIVPLSRARPTPVHSTMFLIMLAWHAVGVGPPIALLTMGRRSGGTRLE